MRIKNEDVVRGLRRSQFGKDAFGSLDRARRLINKYRHSSNSKESFLEIFQRVLEEELNFEGGNETKSISKELE